jgi:hypothetical protein
METDGTKNMTDANNLEHGVTRKLARYLSHAKPVICWRMAQGVSADIFELAGLAIGGSRIKPRISRLPLYRLLPDRAKPRFPIQWI